MERIGVSLSTPINPLPEGSSLLLGAFDGVHLGHRTLIREAHNHNGPIYAFLFSKPLGAFFPGHKAIKVLTSLDDKLRIFSSEGLDGAVVMDVGRAFFDLSPEEFMNDIIAPLKPSRLIVGEDYTFGKGGAGNVSLLSSRFPTSIVPLLSLGGEKISAHRIVSLIEKGEVEEASDLLGKPYEIKGKVVKGFENGRKIGFPTANVSLSVPYILPKEGVYAGISYLRGLPYPSIINVGKAPTVGLLKEAIVECYMDGFEGDCYDETIYVEFDRYLRDERPFDSLTALKSQLETDLNRLRKGD